MKTWTRVATVTPILLAALITVGCATDSTLIKEGEGVRIVKDDPPKECKYLGDVSGSGMGVTDMTVFKNQMRNQAARMGANVVRIETAYSGTAFRCP